MSIDTPEFREILADIQSEPYLIMDENVARLIAYIDGRTAGTALEGWKLVPVEPTPEMVEVAFVGVFEDQDILRQRGRREAMAKNYRAMIAAAPASLNGKEEAK